MATTVYFLQGAVTPDWMDSIAFWEYIIVFSRAEKLELERIKTVLI
jgi:hypothetical protein